MEPSAAAREWGQRQAATSPRWTDEKWKRVAALLSMKLAPAPQPPGQAEDDSPPEAA
jgi:hypothetical protein